VGPPKPVLVGTDGCPASTAIRFVRFSTQPLGGGRSASGQIASFILMALRAAAMGWEADVGFFSFGFKVASNGDRFQHYPRP
jgi:hypothetical protein